MTSSTAPPPTEASLPPRKRRGFLRFLLSPWVLLLVAAAVVPWALLSLRAGSDIESIRFEVRPPEYAIELPGRGFDQPIRVLMAGFYTPRADGLNLQEPERGLAVVAQGSATGSTSGGLELPRAGFLVAIPPGAHDFGVSLESSDFTVTRPPELLDADLDVADVAARPIVEFQETAVLRSQRVAVITVSPVQYDPLKRQLKRFTRLEVKVVFRKGTDASLVPASPGDDSPAFERVLERSLVNYAEGKAWRVRPRAPSPAIPSEVVSAAAEGRAFKIDVAADALYQLSLDDLVKAGLASGRGDSVSRPPSFLRLFTPSGREIAVEPLDQPAGAVRFYAQKAASRFTDRNVYWAVVASEPGLRAGDAGVTPDPAAAQAQYERATHFEQDILYRSQVPPGQNTDHWFWAFLQGPGGETAAREFPFTLGFAPEPNTQATLVLSVAGFPTGRRADYALEARVNGQPVGRWAWDGNDQQVVLAALPAGLLHAGENKLRLSIPDEPGAPPDRLVFLKAFDVRAQAPLAAENDALSFTADGAHPYAAEGFSTDRVIAYDVTDPAAPVRLQAATSVAGRASRVLFQAGASGPRRFLLVASSQVKRPDRIERAEKLDILDQTPGADYLIVAPRDFLPDVQPLITHYQAQGLRVRAAAVEQVYDAFSGGLLDPEAIRRFITYTMASWQPPAPSFVLLVGDGSFDFKDYMGTGTLTRLPPYLAFVDPLLGETASDNRYAAVVGDDLLPDVLIGRFPAQTRDQVAAMVAKSIAYAQSSARNSGPRRALVVADNPDKAGDFVAISNSLAAQMQDSHFAVSKLYFDGVKNHEAQTRKEIAAQWARGASLITYVGHAAITMWAHEDLFNAQQAAELPNATALPVVLSLTCYCGFWHFPGMPSTSVSLVRNPQGGAVASFAAAGLAVATGHDLLGQGFLDAAADRQPVPLGAAALMAKLRLFQSTSRFRDLLDTFSVLGDPGIPAP